MGKKILIIDDSEQDRKIIKRFLQGAGYTEILLAERGEDGVKKAELEKPDLVITDTNLPDIDGFEVCSKIRKFCNSEITKIIVTTGSIDAIDAVQAREVGADDYCVKTSDFAALIEVVKGFI